MITAKLRRTKHVDLVKVHGNIKGPQQVKVGLVAGEADSDVIMRGIWNHYGTKRGIPERPFLSNAMRDNKSKYRAGMKSSAKKLLTGGTSLHTTLSKLGILAQGDVQSEITSLQTPPNAASTIAQKGSSNPLIDTGEMRGAVTYKIGDF